MNHPKKFTDEQLTKLKCDSHAFLEVSRLAADYIDQAQAAPMSTIHNSMTTAMLTNLGMAFELKLKALKVSQTMNGGSK